MTTTVVIKTSQLLDRDMVKLQLEESCDVRLTHKMDDCFVAEGEELNLNLLMEHPMVIVSGKTELQGLSSE